MCTMLANRFDALLRTVTSAWHKAATAVRIALTVQTLRDEIANLVATSQGSARHAASHVAAACASVLVQRAFLQWFSTSMHAKSLHEAAVTKERFLEGAVGA